MFGMSSEDFWENDPQLYWAYRTFYLKKLEQERKQQQEYIKYSSWLNGELNYVAFSTSLNNAFSKQKKDYPKYNDIFGIENENKEKTKDEINKEVQEEFNSWARL